MNIETYARFVSKLYIGIFVSTTLMCIVEIWNRLRNQKATLWAGIFPCSFLYSISALLSTLFGFIAYDDLSNPNYARYENWALHDFVLQDIRTFLIWLSIGISLYLLSEWNSPKKSIHKKRLILFIFIFILLSIILKLFMQQPFFYIENLCNYLKMYIIPFLQAQFYD